MVLDVIPLSADRENGTELGATAVYLVVVVVERIPSRRTRPTIHRLQFVLGVSRIGPPLWVWSGRRRQGVFMG
jgi:hypothetical protein